MLVACPHCNGGIENRSDIAATVVVCPHCRKQLTMPAWQELVIPEAKPLQSFVPAYEQPALHIHTSRPREKRLHSSGWFSRGFSTTAGVLLAIMAVFIGLPMLACMGCFAVGTAGMGEATRQRAASENVTREQAMAALRKHGIPEIARNALIDSEGPVRSIAGDAIGDDGAVHSIHIEFRISHFSDATRWELNKLVIDGDDKQRAD